LLPPSPLATAAEGERFFIQLRSGRLRRLMVIPSPRLRRAKDCLADFYWLVQTGQASGYIFQ